MSRRFIMKLKVLFGPSANNPYVPMYSKILETGYRSQYIEEQITFRIQVSDISLMDAVGIKTFLCKYLRRYDTSFGMDEDVGMRFPINLSEVIMLITRCSPTLLKEDWLKTVSVDDIYEMFKNLINPIGSPGEDTNKDISSESLHAQSLEVAFMEMFRPLDIYESIDKKEAFEPILEYTNYAKVLCSKIIDYKDSSSTTYDFYRVYVPNNLILNTPNELVTLNTAINQGDTIIESVKIHKHLPVLIIEVFKTTPNTHSTYFERRYVDTTEIVENFISENSEK
jgi:hypothetical protein